jgi:hypothetical protein
MSRIKIRKARTLRLEALGEEVKTMQSVKIIKKGKRKVPEIRSRIKSAVGPNTWSIAVQSWIGEFQKRRRGDSLSAFNRLFK